MRILFLDIASHNGLLACVTENDVISLLSIDHRISDQDLVPLIESTLKKAGWTYEDLTQIACIVGPGGFTSLRIAVACANVLSDQLEIPSADIGLWELYAARCMDEDAVWIHSTKKNEVFIRSVTDKCITWGWPLPIHTTLQEAVESTPSVLQWCGELLPEHQKAFEAKGMQHASLRSLEEILPQFLQGLTYEKHVLTPWYGRGW